MYPEMSFSKGVLSDATKSISRAYINNFQDKGKQAAIDMFLVRRCRITFNDILIYLTGKHEQPTSCHNF